MQMISREIKVWHLELFDNPNLPVADARPYNLVRQTELVPEFNRFLYTTVGSQWYWLDRLNWSYEDWNTCLKSPETQVWVAYQQADPIGYFELALQPLNSVEISYFGLLPDFIGRGLGGLFLNDAIDRAFMLGGDRVWLHTCTLDHPRALQNYQSRGFKIFKEEQFTTQLPAHHLQPWPGANSPHYT